MLRKLTLGCAVVVAMLAAPAMSAHSMMGGMHSMGGVHSAGGMHSPHMATGWGSHHAAMVPHHHFVRFHHFHHFHQLTSGTDTYSSPARSAWAVAGGGCQRDGVGTECGFAIEHGPFS